ASGYRLFAADALGRIHSDAAVQKVLELLAGEEDFTVRANLGHALVANFAFEGVEPVRQMILKGDYDTFMPDLREGVVEACKLMGVDFPERNTWEKEVRERQLALDRNLRGLSVDRPRSQQVKSQPAPVSQPFLEPERKRVGRNDPCPCGSGKKFKVCC